MILDPGYRTDAFDALSLIPSILKKRKAENTPVSEKIQQFAEAIWISFQKRVTEYGLSEEDAIYEALNDALTGLGARSNSANENA